MENFDPNNTKIDENSNKNILIYYIESVTIKDSKYVWIKSVNPLYLIFNKVNGYFAEINKSKYLTPVPTNDSKEKNKKIWLIRSVTKNSDDYNEKYMKIKFNSDDKTIKR